MERQLFVTSPKKHRRLIANGLGVGFVLKFNLSLYEDDPGIALAPFAEPAFRRQLMICFRSSEPSEERAIALRRFVANFFGMDSPETLGHGKQLERGIAGRLLRYRLRCRAFAS